MAGIEDNNAYECEICHLVRRFTDLLRRPDGPECPRCGSRSFRQLTISIVCDFCSTPATVDTEFWSYPAEDFLYTIQQDALGTHGSKGPWGACEICHELIEEGDHNGLALRSVEKDVERDPAYKGHQHMLFAIAKQMHKDFFAHRTGPARKEQM